MSYEILLKKCKQKSENTRIYKNRLKPTSNLISVRQNLVFFRFTEPINNSNLLKKRYLSYSFAKAVHSD